MKDRILITGASSGIGYEMTLQLAAKKYDLVLVARRLDKLQSMKELLERQHGIQVKVLAKDLSHATEAAELHEELRQENIEITMLVNNAGTGLYGEFIDTDLQAELRMIELNISSVVTLSKLFLQDNHS